MSRGIQFNLTENLYLKDPQNTAYGQRLLQNTVELMAQIGFESFTFKKLGNRMKSTETSVYRYFENKHKLLTYICCWYWEWVHYLIDIHTLNVNDPEEVLKIMIHQLLYASEESSMTVYINESLLHDIVVLEGVKSFHVSEVDKDNDLGFFDSYKSLNSKIASIIQEVNPNYPYPESLAITLHAMAHDQIYFATHFPALSSFKQRKNLSQIEEMIRHTATALLLKD